MGEQHKGVLIPEEIIPVLYLATIWPVN